MTARKVRLGPGGKVLMVLLGLGLILWGLDAYGYLDGLRDALGWQRGKAAAAVHRAVERKVSPTPAAGIRRVAPDAAAGRGQASGPRAPEADGPSVAAGALPLALPGQAGGPLRDGGDALWTGVAGPSPRARLEAVAGGRLDLAPVALPDLLLLDGGRRHLVVLGALPPVARYPCAEGADPVQALVAGASVHFDRLSDRLRLALLLEARGLDPAALDRGGEGKVSISAAPRDAGDHCVELAALGVDGPRVVVARGSAVRVEGRAYLAAAKRRGALTPAARAYLLAPASDPYGYAARAAAYARLVATLQSTTAPAVPGVGRDLLAADANGVLELFTPAKAAPAGGAR